MPTSFCYFRFTEGCSQCSRKQLWLDSDRQTEIRKKKVIFSLNKCFHLNLSLIHELVCTVFSQCYIMLYLLLQYLFPIKIHSWRFPPSPVSFSSCLRAGPKDGSNMQLCRWQENLTILLLLSASNSGVILLYFCSDSRSDTNRPHCFLIQTTLLSRLKKAKSLFALWSSQG